ncbi:hypothetical protein PHLCEN_2v5095 [Hermanssonia centrifuga]|uniref:Uncharacterized protein n=1 Tax=Hermanssonia centrifuga TaxID=98765 RepID=A0A2R6PC20_9APHY|nr:hypothetical protein PHLCEN_2v5095 [Hermanssonia centrifuga]
MKGDIPELYFTPTAAELKAVQSSLAARTQSLANAPLRTQAMRDADQKAREARWPTLPDQTPPKRELKVSDPKVRDLNLSQLQLAPSSVLHLKFEDDSLNHVDVPAPLEASVLARAEDLPIYSANDSSPRRETAPAPSQTAASDSSSSKTNTPKIPKWMKLGHSRQISFRRMAIH